MGLWQPKLTFSSPALERRYKAAHNSKLASRELGSVFITHACLWVACSLWVAFQQSGEAARCIKISLLAAVAVAVPQLLRKCRPQLYVQYRKWWMAVIRLIIILLPTLSMRVQRPPTTAGVLSMVALAARVPRMWVTACELRLDFRSHLALDALQSARLIFVDAHRFCSSSYAQNPAVVHVFLALSRQCSQLAGLLLPMQQLPDSQQSPDHSAGHHCMSLTLAGNLLFGLYISGVAVYVSERLHRADFLFREAAALCMAPAEASERLGLPRQEVAEVCLFDPLSEWLRWGMLLPPLAAATWLTVVALVPLGIGDPQHTGAG